MCSPKSHDSFKNSKEWQFASPAAGGSLVIHPWGEVHHLRNCPKCGSTLARVIEEGIPELTWDGKGDTFILKDGRVTVHRSIGALDDLQK
jgi:hypothetical protein